MKIVSENRFSGKTFFIQFIPGQEVCPRAVHEEAHVLHVAVLGGDVQRGAPVAPHAAHRVHLGAGLRQDAQAPAEERGEGGFFS